MYRYARTYELSACRGVAGALKTVGSLFTDRSGALKTVGSLFANSDPTVFKAPERSVNSDPTVFKAPERSVNSDPTVFKAPELSTRQPGCLVNATASDWSTLRAYQRWCRRFKNCRGAIHGTLWRFINCRSLVTDRSGALKTVGSLFANSDPTGLKAPER